MGDQREHCHAARIAGGTQPLLGGSHENAPGRRAGCEPGRLQSSTVANTGGRGYDSGYESRFLRQQKPLGLLDVYSRAA